MHFQDSIPGMNAASCSLQLFPHVRNQRIIRQVYWQNSAYFALSHPYGMVIIVTVYTKQFKQRILLILTIYHVHGLSKITESRITVHLHIITLRPVLNKYIAAHTIVNPIGFLYRAVCTRQFLPISFSYFAGIGDMVTGKTPEEHRQMNNNDRFIQYELPVLP